MTAIIHSLLLSGEALNGEINARKSACSENGNSNGYHNMPEPIKLKYVCKSHLVVSGFKIWFEIWSLRIQLRFWCEIRFKIWDFAWIFESPVKNIWDSRVRFYLRFAHHPLSLLLWHHQWCYARKISNCLCVLWSVKLKPSQCFSDYLLLSDEGAQQLSKGNWALGPLLFCLTTKRVTRHAARLSAGRPAWGCMHFSDTTSGRQNPAIHTSLSAVHA